MEQNVLNTDLTGKVAVVTGASGTLCSIFAKALARAGAKVALLGRNMEKLKALADEIEAEGGIARGYTCNVMNKANCLQAAEDVMAELGPCDILVNGAGGNNARANTDKEYFEMADLEGDTVTFFDLDESGVEMVFDLNFIGTLLPTQAFARQMVGRPGCNVLNISSMNAYLPLTKIPAYSGSKAAVTNFTQWLAVHFSKVGIRVNAIAPGFFAITAFIVPFAFVYRPAILLEGTMVEIIIAYCIVVAATYLLACGIAGYLFRPLKMWERIACYVVAFIFILPSSMSDIIGIAGCALIMAYCFMTGKKNANKAQPA